MSTSMNWWVPFSEHGLPTLVAVLMAKITVLLAVAWCAHALLRRANPRWRVLLWRSTGIGMLLLIALTACPPIVSWGVLPPEAAPSEPLASRNSGPSVQPTEQAVPVVTHESPPAAALARDHEPTDSTWRERSRLPQSSATSDRDRPEATVVTEFAPTTGAPWSQSAVVLGAIGGVWLAGLMGLAAWTLVGLLRLRAIIRRSQPVPDWVSEQAAHVNDTIGCKRAFVLRKTADVATPCLVGIWRPMILLPERQVDRARCEELPAILMHETAHLKAGDLRWNAVIHALAMLFWLHPLVWRIRLAHAGACETVADAVAADHVGDVPRYIRTLAKLAVQMRSPALGTALPMASTSSVMQRIEALQRKLFLARLPRGRMILAVASAAIAPVLLGGIALTRAAADPQVIAVADDEEGTKENRLFLDVIEFEAETGTQPPGVKARFLGGTAGQLVIHATAKDTGEPLAGVKIHFRGSLNRRIFERDLVTSDEGTAGLHWPARREFGRLFMSCQKDGFVPIRYLWRDHRTPDEQIPKQLDLQFETGKWIGGVVQDQSGRPIEGATVKVQTIYLHPRPGHYWGTVGEPKTDAAGRWKWKGVPDDLSYYSVDIEHPDYVEGRNELRPGTEGIYVMKQSGRLTGRVVNEDGEPIERASVLLGYPHNSSGIPKTATDADGRFVLENCPPGESIVTVDDGRHSPAQRKVVVGEQDDLGEFRLGPGHTIRVRVVNGRGEPVEGAWFEVSSWRNTDTLCCLYSTDAEGRIVWEGAPEDSVLCTVRATDYLEVTRHPLQASDEEHVITLLSELTISGKVTDAQTGLPIPEFVIRRGFDVQGWGMHWVKTEEDRFKDGAYEFKIDQQIDGAHRLRVEVPGYHVAVSRSFKDDEGAVTYNFALEPGEEMTGTVLGPAGDPVAGARVGLAKERSGVYLDAGSFQRNANRAEMATTDESGEFAFPPESDEPFLLIVIHDSGFAQLTREQFKKSSQIKLAPWGRIEGQVLLRDKPAPSCRVQYSPNLSDDQKKFFRGCYYWANADANGRFELERVIPGSGSVERVIVTEDPGGSALLSPGWHQPVEVAAGATATVTVGGNGRTVVGRFEFDRNPDLTPNWASYPLMIQRWDKDKDQPAEPTYQCHGAIDTTGRFAIPDVRPGNYRLTRHVSAVPADGQTRYVKLGEAKHDFRVPPVVGGQSDEPLDLGAIAVKVESEVE